MKAGAYITSCCSTNNWPNAQQAAGSRQQAAGSSIRVGFVATSSITQGEQVAQLWPILFDRYGLEIAFAHRTFAWGSEARGKAHVHVVIIGLAHRDAELVDKTEKRLFSYPDIKGDPVESRHGALTAICSMRAASPTGISW